MLKAVQAVQTIETLIESQQFFTYVAVNDNATCSRCDHYDQSSMTRTEVVQTFDYLIKYSPTMWFPMVHPNCRCVLYFEEEDLPRPDSLTNDELISKVKDEIIAKKTDQLNPELTKDEKVVVIKREVERRTQGLMPEEIEDDDDLWDLVALGVLDSLYKRKHQKK